MAGVTAIQAARAELERVRAEHPRGSSQGAAAFQALCQAYAAQGRRIDELRTYSPDEDERFFANTAQGPDGHVYWLGGRVFLRNDGAQRRPGRWWWEQRYGPLQQNDGVRPICGERACINPEHAALERSSDRQRVFSDLQIIGALQVAALRLGRAPSKKKWDLLGVAPSRTTILARFGSWPKALQAAGLEPHSVSAQASAAQCLEALRLSRRVLGYWPAWGDLEQPLVRDALAARGLPRRPNTICSRLGCRWPEALRRAGKR